MRVENVRGKSSKRQYFDKDGNSLPGASTIAELLGPVGGLGFWGFQIGKSGQVDDYWAYMGGLAAAGECAHVMIEAYLSGEQPNLYLSMFTGREIEIATSCLEKFKGWAEGKRIEFIWSERPLVSEEYKFGGTPDLYLKVNDLYTIIDLKSASQVRKPHKIQTSGYRQLVTENGEPVDQLVVLALGRDPEDSLRKWSTKDDADLWQTFEHLLKIYRLEHKPKRTSADDAA